MRSSRQLEHASQRQLEWLWLVRKLTPALHTIAPLRKEHFQALTRVGSALTRLGKKLDLVGRACLAMDGSQCKTVHSKARNCTETKLPPLLTHIHEKIDTSLQA